jgi:O-antigen/teichoic acid export membrane protein
MTSFALWLVGLGGRGTVLLVATLNLIVLARALGPVGRGEYFLFVTLVLVLTALADFGISQSAVVFGGNGEVAMRQLHSTLLRLAFTVALGVGIVVVGVVQASEVVLLIGIPHDRLLIAIALLPLSTYANFWTAAMIGTRRVVAVNAVQLAMNALSLGANAAFVATTGDLSAALAIYAAMLAAQAATMFAIVGWITGNEMTAAAPFVAIARRLLLFGLRGYPGSLSTLLWARSAVFVLNAFHGPSAVGIYSVAQQLAEKLLVPIQAMQDVIYARMARLPRDEATVALNRFLRVTVAAVLPTVAIALLVSPALVTILFSDAFGSSTLTLRLLLAGSAVQSIPVVLATYFLAQLRKPGLLSLLAWSNALLNIALLLILVPPAAASGAAAAMLVSEIAGTMLALALYLRIARTDAISALVLRRQDLTLVSQQAQSLIRR